MSKIKQINNNKLKVKHYLKVHHFCDSFPEWDDLLFELCQSEEIMNQEYFDYQFIKFVVDFKLKKEEFHNLMNIIVNKKYAEEIVKGQKHLFKLLNHPWK